MIALSFVDGESTTGKKGNELSHWYAAARNPAGRVDFDATGDTALDAAMNLSRVLHDYIAKE